MKRFLLGVGFSCCGSMLHAWGWSDLWLTRDQHAQQLMMKQDFKQASTLFQNDNWRAAALFRAGEYQHAAELYQVLHTEQGYYNEGNARAYAGQYKQALAAYKKALALNAANQDAQHNYAIVSELLKKQQEQQNKEQQNKEQQNKDQQNKDQQNKEQQNKEQQNKEQQNKDQQNKEQQDKEQQNKEQQNKAQQNKAQQNKDQQNKEQQQVKDQWLRLIPDDPGGLLREKFLRDHLRKERGWYQ